MNSLIDYTDKAIMKIVLDQVKQMNPWLIIGEQLNSVCEVVSGGKVIRVDKYEPPEPANLIPIHNLPANIVPPKAITTAPVTARTVKLKMQDIQNFRTAGMSVLDFKLQTETYLHPYTIEIPNREWLEDYTIGEMVSVKIVDQATFQPVYIEVPLTQQMVEDNSEVYFRFALSEI